MSTYTDLLNKVKETLNVDYHSRETNQRALFMNPENEFFGKFHGKMDATNSSITGGVISGVTILSANLKEDIILPGNIDITKIGKNISYISSAVDTLEEKHDYETELIRHEISGEIWKREYADLSIVGTLLSVRDQIYDDLDFEVSARKFYDSVLSNDYLTRISSEEAARKFTDNILFNEVENLHKTDAELSAAIELSVSKLDAKIDAEAAQRIAEIKRVDDRIDDLDLSSLQRYLSAMEALSIHAADNIKQFNSMSAAVDNKVEHDKHYVIINENNTTKYPYQLSDFAVNVLEIDDVVGYVKHNDNIIGRLEKKTFDEYPMYLEIIDFTDPDIRQALAPNTYVFDESHGAHDTGCNNYKIVYQPSIALSSSSFKLLPNNLPYLNVYAPFFENLNIAKIRDYAIDVSNNKVISGAIAVDTEITELTTFNKFGGRLFNNTELSVLSAETERIVYNGDNTFKFLKNITRHNYFSLIDRDGIPFAKIYLEGGILSNDSGIEALTINVFDPLSTIATLRREDGYATTISTDTIMSCDIVALTFDIVHKNEIYKYGFFLSDDTTFEGEMLGYVVPGTPNHSIDEGAFGVISANIENVVFNPSFKKTYELKINKSSLVKEWKASDVNDEGDTLDIIFNGTHLYVWTYKKETGAVTSRKYLVKKTDPEIFNPEDCYKHLHTTDFVAFEFNDYEEHYVKYDININTERKLDSNPEYTLNIDTESANTLTVQLPKKNFDDISRELNLVLKITSIFDRVVKINVIDYNGFPIKVFFNKHHGIYAKTNKYLSLNFNEIKPDVYLVTDLDIDHSEIMHLIKKLRKEVGEISVELSTDYSTKIDDLSTAVYDDLNAISTDLQDQIISNDNDIDMLSSCVDDIYLKIKGGITYRGIVNVIDKLCEHGGSNFHISNLFFIDFGSSPEHHGYKQPDPTYTAETVLSSGFMYVAKKTDDNLGTHWKVDGVEIEAHDWVILNFYDDKCRKIKDITSADVDIIDAMDDDLVTLALLSTVSADLQGQITSNDVDIADLYDKSETLSNCVDFLSTTIDNVIVDYDTKIQKLSADLSGEIDALSASLSNTVELCVENLQDQIFDNDADIDFLSGKTAFLLSTDREHVAYQGTMAKYVPEKPDIETNYRLSAFINNSLNPEYKGKLKLGFMFHLSAEQSCLYDIDNKKMWLGSNDYFIINKDVIVNNVRIEDLDIIRDGEGEAKYLSAELVRQLYLTSSYIVETIDAVSNDIEAQLNATSSFLSTTVDYLSDNIDYLSSEIDFISDSIDISAANLQNQIISNDNDIEFLSNEVSTAIRRDLSSLRYFGDVQLSDKYDYAGIAELTGNTLFGLLYTNKFSKGPDREIYTGFTYRANGNALSVFEISSDHATKVKTVRNNEILIVNKYVDKLSNISLDDVEIVKDYDLSVKILKKYTEDLVDLSVSHLVSGDINYTGKNTFSNETKFDSNVSVSNVLTANTELEIIDVDANVYVDGLISSDTNIIATGAVNVEKIHGLLGSSLTASYGYSDLRLKGERLIDGGDIEKIDVTIEYPEKSGTIALFSDVQELSDSLSDTVQLSVEDLQKQISSNDDDIETLSIDLDALELSVQSLSDNVSAELSTIKRHYDETFEKDVHIDVETGDDISVDMLRLTEETGSGAKYTLHLSAGTLVLMPIK